MSSPTGRVAVGDAAPRPAATMVWVQPPPTDPWRSLTPAAPCLAAGRWLPWAMLLSARFLESPDQPQPCGSSPSWRACSSARAKAQETLQVAAHTGPARDNAAQMAILKEQRALPQGRADIEAFAFDCRGEQRRRLREVMQTTPQRKPALAQRAWDFPCPKSAAGGQAEAQAKPHATALQRQLRPLEVQASSRRRRREHLALQQLRPVRRPPGEMWLISPPRPTFLDGRHGSHHPSMIVQQPVALPGSASVGHNRCCRRRICRTRTTPSGPFQITGFLQSAKAFPGKA